MNNARRGNSFQADFEARWARLGKWGWLDRIEDAADLYGLNDKRVVNTTPKSADYIVGFKGICALCEAKSTLDRVGFKVAQLRPSQRRALIRSAIAGTPHFIVIRNDNTKDVYFVPGAFLRDQVGTVSWSDLKPYYWPEDQICPSLLM